jgi:flavin reductase (DIM6/NTAB) family NADH-FMN oxidoreductase RutF
MKSFDPKSLSIQALHGFLLGAIAPRPIALASTIDENGRHNLAPFSFFNVFSANPPVVIFSPARRGTDSTTKHTLDNAKMVKEVVINVVNYDMVQQMVLTSANFPAGVSEFEKSGFTPIASETIKPMRVKESPVQFECEITKIIELGNGPASGNLIFAEVKKFHVNENILAENGRIDTQKIDLVGRSGGDFYCRAHGNSLFEISRPNDDIVGMDLLPLDIKTSAILTGNDLAILANEPALPDETDINEFKLLELHRLFIKYEEDAVGLEKALHLHAKALIANGNITDAWKTLLAFNN